MNEIDPREPYLADEYTDELLKLLVDADLTAEEIEAYLRFIYHQK